MHPYRDLWEGALGCLAVYVLVCGLITLLAFWR